jgi:preprotein translocase SecE subunit
MALATNKEDEKTMATDVIVPGADEPGSGDSGGGGGGRPQPDRAQKVESSSTGGGFFSIYKKGQGYWTRLCTAGGAVLFIVFLISFLYQQLPPWIRPALTPANATARQTAEAAARAQNITVGTCIAVAAGFALLCWRLMNKPDNVDFLIATDSEMKKVNWTSKKELIGSTKVVIIFMLIIAAVLFLIDILFGYVFYWFTVLKSPPL